MHTDRINDFMEALENGDFELNLEAHERDKVECSCCGRMVDEAETRVLENGDIVCDDCIDEHYFICENCGKIIHEDEIEWYHDEVYCNDCFEDNFDTCDDCGEVFRRWDGHWTHDRRHICQSCYEDNYVRCCQCDELYHIDEIEYHDEEPYCENCLEEMRRRTIKNYSFKPYPIFYGGSCYSSSLFMGVELEIDRGGEDHENARELLDIVNERNEHIYCKHDGSIEDGFEIVSHPATLEYHQNNIAWGDMMKKALAMGYRSHDTQTCGLHVHVSRDALGNTYDEQEDNIAKILYFVENNWYQVLRFTRRSESNLNRWASRYGLADNVKNTYTRAKGDYNRYHCINLQNDNTIEFRVFRGTLKYSTFIATLQFVNVLCSICRHSDMGDIEKMSWTAFTRKINPESYPELIAYLTEKDLY